LIFNDINKEAYPASLPLIKEKLRAGGVLIIDNILYSGRIFDKRNKAASTEGVRKFTKAITHDPDWIVSLAPVRDGVIVAYKK
jgi:predicted O-methyltransferase YrrM